MIKAEEVDREMSTGLSAVCSWCEHYHNAIDRDGEKKSCGKDCGGPASGRGFPLYKGPMVGHLHEICFICGKSATSGVDIGGRMIGVCDRMGPRNKTCLDKLRAILARQKGVVVKERVVPIVGDG